MDCFIIVSGFLLDSSSPFLFSEILTLNTTSALINYKLLKGVIILMILSSISCTCLLKTFLRRCLKKLLD